MQIHRRFLDLLVFGATIRELTRRLTKPKLNEIELVGIKDSLALYRNDYKILLDEFASYANKRSEPAYILPFTLANDSLRELEI